MKRLVALALAAALVAVGCGDDEDDRPTGPVLVGAVVSISGDSAALGRSQAEGIRLAEDALKEAGGPELAVLVVDEGTSTSVGEKALQQVLARGADVLVGPTHSNVARAVYPEADVAEVPMIGISMTVPGLTAFRPYLWRTSVAGDRVLPPAVQEAARRSDAGTAFLLYGNDDLLTRAEAELFTDSLVQAGVSLVGSATFVKNQRSFATQIAAAKASGAELLCVAALPGDALGILREMDAAGLRVAIVGGNGFNSSAIPRSGIAAAEGLVVGSAWSLTSERPANVRFVEAYRAEYGRDPDQFAAQAYAGMQVVAAVVRRGATTAAEIQTELRRLGPVDTPLGDLEFDVSRDAVHRTWISVVQGRRFVTKPAFT